MFVQSDATRLPFADQAFDLTIGSPPYCDARTYGIGAQRDCVEWVAWMLDVTTEAQRVTKGPVIGVAAGVTRKRNYWPACEGLMWEWWKRGGDCQLYRPVYWHRVGIPGSGQSDWFRADVEMCMCFKRPGELPWSDNTACGHPPKWAPGGEMSHRLTTGQRVNQWGPVGSPKGGGAKRADGDLQSRERPSHRVMRCGKGSRRPNGEHKQGGYEMPALANPGNLLKVLVGGGVMGSKLAHENEAPYPVGVPEFFIRSLCPPGGIVFDPFAGSGTTGQAAKQFGRRVVLGDLRHSQCLLSRRRISEVQTRMELSA